MKAMMAAILVTTVLLASPGLAWEPLTRVYQVPVDRVWTATLAALETQGWGSDDTDRTIGIIITRSHRMAGDRPQLWSKTLRVRLRLFVIALDAERTKVTVAREVFRRERLPWGERDEVIHTMDPAQGSGEFERFLLQTIARTL